MEELIIELSENFTKIIPISEIKKHPSLYWGGNGVGSRWANRRFNYSVIYSKKRKPKTYSENTNDSIPDTILSQFFETANKGPGITGIYVYSKRTNVETRGIREDIKQTYRNARCVICGTNTDIVCDHKNDLYNDARVLSLETQTLDDFQALCNHCNLQKRQVCKKEEEQQKIYSAKEIPRYRQYRFEFPWEKKAFDRTDIYCKNDTYWFDPVEFENKIYCYMSFVLPIVHSLKRRHKI